MPLSSPSLKSVKEEKSESLFQMPELPYTILDPSLSIRDDFTEARFQLRSLYEEGSKERLTSDFDVMPRWFIIIPDTANIIRKKLITSAGHLWYLRAILSSLLLISFCLQAAKMVKNNMTNCNKCYKIKILPR